ncbi:MAG TPA: Rha family transcriptional regulator [Solidesulfovibrio magneticus]|nr:Rha family transcriptional regulator [Solidesulfovibrio magneticus]
MSTSKSLNPPVSIEFLPGERPAVRSVELAKHFGLQHKHVLRDIEGLRKKLPTAFTEPNFGPSEYQDPTGRTLPCYLLTRDAFTLLVMGWSSPRAIEWKLKYIQAFNALEAAALANARAEALAEGARAWLDLPAGTRAWLPQALGYHAKGLNTEEIGKLLDLTGSAVAKALQQARACGMIEAKPASSRRRRQIGQGRRRKAPVISQSGQDAREAR